MSIVPAIKENNQNFRTSCFTYVHYAHMISGAVTLQNCTEEISALNLGHQLNWKVFGGFLAPPGKCQSTTSIKPQLFPSKSYLLHYSPSIQSFNGESSDILAAS
jgi:hypothetical protein